MPHALVSFKDAPGTLWPAWPTKCRIVRNSPSSVLKMIESPKSRVYYLPESASFPEIVAWRTTLHRPGGPLVLRTTGGSNDQRRKLLCVRGLVVGNGQTSSGRAVVYRDSKSRTVTLALLDMPPDDPTTITVSNVPRGFLLTTPATRPNSTHSNAYSVVLVGKHKAAIVPMAPLGHPRHTAVLRYDKTLEARYAMRDSFGRKVFEVGPNRYHLPHQALVHCSKAKPHGPWIAERAVLVQQPVTDAKRIDNWDGASEQERTEQLSLVSQLLLLHAK